MTAEHWQAAYEKNAPHSWDQDAPAMDLGLLVNAGLDPTDSVIDVGGGDGAFTQSLLKLGHRDLTVLDIADSALDAGRRRLGDRSDEVDWIASDVRRWTPARTWQVWHDRAAFHFLTSEQDRAGYRRALSKATRTGSLVCVGTFADNGPTHCSGLEVARYAPDELAEELREDTLALGLVASGREVHRPPHAAEQHFAWVLLRRQ